MRFHIRFVSATIVQSLAGSSLVRSFVAITTTALMGCGAHTPLKPPTIDFATVPSGPSGQGFKFLKPFNFKECDVAMQLAYGDNIMPKGTLEGSSPFTKQNTLYVVSHPACVKLKGEKGPRIPDAITLVMDDARPNHYGLCEEGTASPLPAEGGTPARTECKWNRQFRDAYPLSFILYSLNDSKLSDYIRFIRVFRNGALAYKWSSHESYGDSPLTGGHVLFISGDALRGSYMPHQAAFDVRLTGAGTEIDEATLNQPVIGGFSAERRIRAALDSILSSPVFMDGKLEPEIDKLKNSAESLACRGEALARGETGANCDKSKKTGDATERAAVSKFYDQIKKGLRRDLKSAQDEAEAQIEELAKAIGADSVAAQKNFARAVRTYWYAQGHPGWAVALEAAERKKRLNVLAAASTWEQFSKIASDDTDITPLLTQIKSDEHEEFLLWFKLRASSTTLETILRDGDKLLDLAASALDGAHKLVDRIRGDVTKLAKDDEAQVRLFNDVFQSLEKTTLFEQYAPNPAPMKDERVLSMTYADKFQWYSLAPWHGVSFRSNEGLEPQASAMTIVPIIDIGGGRVQFAKNRFGDFRFGAGVALTTENVEVLEDGEKKDNAYFRVIPQINVALANFHVGAGYAVGKEHDESDFDKSIRLFVGVDLFKLISGRNVEGFTD